MADVTQVSPEERHRRLREAETLALQLFREVEQRRLIRAGIPESTLNTEVYELAAEVFGVTRHWHKRIVRAGPNTLQPYRENPPDLVIQADDILFFDFGPVFEDWEADLGRTYVLGDDPTKRRLQQDIEQTWHLGKAYFDSRAEITGAELFGLVIEQTKSRGWEFAQAHAGHLIGAFPHEHVFSRDVENYIHPDNQQRLRDPDKNGVPRDWILEIHMIDPSRQIGGFFEQLLTVD